MSGNTKCHLDHTITGSTCPQGSSFNVKSLKQYGGATHCSYASCPFIQDETKQRTRVILVGKAGTQRTIVQPGK